MIRICNGKNQPDKWMGDLQCRRMTVYAISIPQGSISGSAVDHCSDCDQCAGWCYPNSCCNIHKKFRMNCCYRALGDFQGSLSLIALEQHQLNDMPQYDLLPTDNDDIQANAWLQQTYARHSTYAHAFMPMQAVCAHLAATLGTPPPDMAVSGRHCCSL